MMVEKSKTSLYLELKARVLPPAAVVVAVATAFQTDSCDESFAWYALRLPYPPFDCRNPRGQTPGTPTDEPAER